VAIDVYVPIRIRNMLVLSLCAEFKLHFSQRDKFSICSYRQYTCFWKAALSIPCLINAKQRSLVYSIWVKSSSLVVPEFEYTFYASIN
jgi:hypothetical protein